MKLNLMGSTCITGGIIVLDTKNTLLQVVCFLFIKATPRFELGIRVLQTRALPLGYVAILNLFN